MQESRIKDPFPWSFFMVPFFTALWALLYFYRTTFYGSFLAGSFFGFLFASCVLLLIEACVVLMSLLCGDRVYDERSRVGSLLWQFTARPCPINHAISATTYIRYKCNYHFCVAKYIYYKNMLKKKNRKFYHFKVLPPP